MPDQQKIGPWQDSDKFLSAPPSSFHADQPSRISLPYTLLSSPRNLQTLLLRLNQRKKASKGRSMPYSQPEPIFTPSRTGLRPLSRSRRPSASLGRAPDAPSPHLPRPTTERQLATHPSEEPAFASISRHVSTSTPPSAAKSYPQPLPNNPIPYPWPAAPLYMASPLLTAQVPAPAIPPFPPAPRAQPSSSIPPFMTQAQAPAIPPLLSSIHQACSSSNIPPLMAQAPAIPPLLPSLSSAPRAPFSLSSATPRPYPSLQMHSHWNHPP